jgi:hypothetical protein
MPTSAFGAGALTDVGSAIPTIQAIRSSPLAALHEG